MPKIGAQAQRLGALADILKFVVRSPPTQLSIPVKERGVGVSLTLVGQLTSIYWWELMPKEKSDTTELLSDSTRLAMHVCGNYAIQKYYSTEILVNKLFEDFLWKYGDDGCECLRLKYPYIKKARDKPKLLGWRIVQTAVDYSSTEQQLSILAELHGYINNRKTLRCLLTQILESGHACQVSIFENLKGKFSALAKQLFGCRFVQHALDCFPVELWRSVADELVSETVALVQDSYGNYVLQHLLACTRDETYRDAIICKLEGKFSELSQHKFASNVVESCLLHGNLFHHESSRGDFNESLFNMMKHEYGNYVVQVYKPQLLFLCKKILLIDNRQ
ncbi:pumilio homolog 2-like [Zophobas morio]|uniref:pumilio homolog 2-like n=1 Tax=Zophobas morio TaxID=2755281 RepID=UPI003082A480